MYSHYYKKLDQRLQSLNQGTKNVDDYLKQMKIAMIWANIEENREAIIAKFMNGLNHDIIHIMQLHHYVGLKEMVYMVMKVERQVKQKGIVQKSPPLSSSTP